MANDIASLIAAGETKAPITQSSTSLGGIGAQKDQFLKLLLAQLKNQDPLQPPDASKFTEDMTQFGQLEQLFNLNESLGKMNASQMNADRTQAVSLIGKQVEAPGNQFTLKSGESAKLGYTLERSAKTVGMEILDSHGTLVRSYNLGHQAIGTYTQEFDGKDDAGDTLPDGTYQIKMTATDLAGAAVKAASIVRGTVSGVVFDASGPVIQVGNRRVQMSDILSVQGA